MTLPLKSDFGTAIFKGTPSNTISPDTQVVVLNGELAKSVGTVISVTGNVYRSDNKVVVEVEGILYWFYPWDLQTIQ